MDGENLSALRRLVARCLKAGTVPEFDELEALSLLFGVRHTTPKKRGPKPPDARKFAREIAILSEIQHLLDSGVRQTPAIKATADRFHVSEPVVYRMWRARQNDPNGPSIVELLAHPERFLKESPRAHVESIHAGIQAWKGVWKPTGVRGIRYIARSGLVQQIIGIADSADD